MVDIVQDCVLLLTTSHSLFVFHLSERLHESEGFDSFLFYDFHVFFALEILPKEVQVYSLTVLQVDYTLLEFVRLCLWSCVEMVELIGILKVVPCNLLRHYF